MRIRKRKVPLPFSLLSPIPLTDPLLFSLVAHRRPPPYSDHSLTATSPSDLSLSAQHGGEENRACLKSDDDNHDGNDDDEARKEETVTALVKSNEGLGRWSEGERVIPLKKRRSPSSYDNNGGNDSSTAEKTTSNNNSSSKQKRGTTIMEGSRCSRVNGRGWRCCQPTLVGYSLCEHHLGKGRLRSMNTTTVRGASKKKQVVGVVKARSLSSLLGQTTTTTTTNASTGLINESR